MQKTNLGNGNSEKLVRSGLKNPQQCITAACRGMTLPYQGNSKSLSMNSNSHEFATYFDVDTCGSGEEGCSEFALLPIIAQIEVHWIRSQRGSNGDILELIYWDSKTSISDLYAIRTPWTLQYISRTSYIVHQISCSRCRRLLSSFST